MRRMLSAHGLWFLIGIQNTCIFYAFEQVLGHNYTLQIDKSIIYITMSYSCLTSDKIFKVMHSEKICLKNTQTFSIFST